MIKNNILKLVLIAIGAIAMCFFSLLIFGLLVPDECYYHTNKMNYFMSLFYSSGPGDNGHPFPNKLNFIISLLIGGFLGYWFYKIVMNKRKENKNGFLNQIEPYE